MHQLFKQKRFFWLITATILLVWIIISTIPIRNNISFMEKPIGYIVTPIQKAFGYLGMQVSEAYLFFREIGADKEEKDKLRLRVIELEDELRRINDLGKENERLKQLLNLKQEYKNFVFESAEVIGRNPENWNSIILVDKGSNSGVRVNSAVISVSKGLVGKVIEVGPEWSKVMLITDPNSSVSSLIDRTRDLGVVRGDLQGASYGYLRLLYVLPEADISVDDLVITSGFGGIFPKGILIGKVKEVNQESVELTKYSYIEPATDFKRLEEVLIIKEIR